MGDASVLEMLLNTSASVMRLKSNSAQGELPSYYERNAVVVALLHVPFTFFTMKHVSWEEALSYISLSVSADLINVLVHGRFLSKPLQPFTRGPLPAEVTSVVASLKGVGFH